MRNPTTGAGNGSQHQQQSNTQHKLTVAPNKSNTTKTPASSPTQVHMTNVNSIHSFSMTNNVLPTVTFDLRYQQQKLSTRAFFDTGSQRSFVSPEIVKRLNLPIIEKVPIKLSTFGSNSNSCVLDLVRVKVQFGECRIPVRLLVHDQASMELHCSGLHNVAQSLKSQNSKFAVTTFRHKFLFYCIVFITMNTTVLFCIFW